MRQQLDYELLESLLESGKSYKQIVEITGYNKNSVYGFFHRTHGKLTDRNKSRRQVIEITKTEEEILFGTLMGDGNIQKMPNSYFGRTNHCLAQEIYCLHVRENLERLTYPVKYRTVKVNKYPDKVYQQCYFCLKPNENLKYLYDIFYGGKQKDVPEDLSLLTPRAMAYWFMDDGTASGKCSISIATCSFSLEGLLRLTNFLKITYDLDVTIQKDFKLYFSASSGQKFYNLVKEFIIEEMAYKFKYVNSSSAGLKLDKLLETPGEDNQQPSYI